MKLFLLFFLAAIFLIVLQTTFFHLLPMGPVVPDLILVLCVYLGLYHPSVGAAFGAFLLGYSIDIVSSPILGFNAFAMSLVYLAVYLCARSIWLHHPIVSSVVVLLAALVKGATMVLIWAIFLSVDGFWAGAARYVMWEALFAALLAPLVFALLRRGQHLVDRFTPVTP
ncbi:MAG TPA: rod shape-determining protein MreD [Candidatus Limnocylindrales bacterium]|nr:rod shape-determining protein MreD [Candidatus Limnocylindrales bacterium]